MIPSANRDNEKKSDRVQSMFAQVAPRYDWANQVLSFGIHHLWRNQVVRAANLKSDMSILDCATGTGDLLIAFAKRLEQKKFPAQKLVGLDFTKEMLDLAAPKAAGLSTQIDWLQGDVQKLPFPDATFDLVTISFGIRNVEDPVQGLREMGRVLKPGGQLIVLEFGQPNVPGFKQAYRFYSEVMLPRIGGWLTGQHQAYDYLQRTSAAFPAGEAFCDMVRSTGKFSSVSSRGMSLGISYLTTAVAS